MGCIIVVLRHVMSGVNPQGCQVFSCKRPSATELDHDFLWRTTRSLPEHDRIGIFTHSYYEDVLIVREHQEILCNQGLPDQLLDEKTVWQGRYRSIVNLENHLYRYGTRVIGASRGERPPIAIGLEEFTEAIVTQ